MVGGTHPTLYTPVGLAPLGPPYGFLNMPTPRDGMPLKSDSRYGASHSMPDFVARNRLQRMLEPGPSS